MVLADLDRTRSSLDSEAEHIRKSGEGSPMNDDPTTQLPPNDPSRKTVADVLGQIVWLMTQSKHHRGLFLSDLEWAIMPAILGKQFKLFYHEDQPKAAVFYAMVDEETKERLDSTGNPKLRLAEWRSGQIPYVVDAVAPFGDREQLMVEFGNELQKDLAAASTSKGAH